MAKVDFLNNVDDLETATLASTGLYSRAIGKMVGMTPCRAQYRVHKSGGSAERRAWREGTSPLFKQVMSVIKNDVQERVKQRIAAAQSRAASMAKQAKKAAKKAAKKSLVIAFLACAMSANAAGHEGWWHRHFGHWETRPKPVRTAPSAVEVHSVPDSGATALLFGTACAGLWFIRRKAK